MTRQRIPFFLAGLTAGLICFTLGTLGSPEMAVIALIWGGGPLFFVAIVAGIIITDEVRYFQPGLLRYFAGLVLCTISYFGAVIAFWWVFGLSPAWIGFRPSDSIGHFGIDVWLGLIAAGAIGATGIALFSALLTARWSKALLERLMLAGLFTILVTFIVNLPFQRDWSFLGVLLPLGNALFCLLIGTQIRLNRGALTNDVPAPTI